MLPSAAYYRYRSSLSAHAAPSAREGRGVAERRSVPAESGPISDMPAPQRAWDARAGRASPLPQEGRYITRRRQVAGGLDENMYLACLPPAASRSASDLAQPSTATHRWAGRAGPQRRSTKGTLRAPYERNKREFWREADGALEKASKELRKPLARMRPNQDEVAAAARAATHPLHPLRLACKGLTHRALATLARRLSG